MAHHAGTIGEYALGEIKIRRTPVTINLYDIRLAHTAKPGMKIVDGKVEINSIGIPESSEDLSSPPGIDVRPSCQETYNMMVPYKVVGEPEWTRRYSHCSYEDGTSVNRIYVPVEPSEDSVEEDIGRGARGGTGYGGREPSPRLEEEEREARPETWESRHEPKMEYRRRKREAGDDCCCVLM